MANVTQLMDFPEPISQIPIWATIELPPVRQVLLSSVEQYRSCDVGARPVNWGKIQTGVVPPPAAIPAAAAEHEDDENDNEKRGDIRVQSLNGACLSAHYCTTHLVPFSSAFTKPLGKQRPSAWSSLLLGA